MRSKRSRYQRLGDHFTSILHKVSEDIDKYIDNVVAPSLPDLHSKEKGVCNNIDLKDNCKSLESCVKLHYHVENCLNNRPKHMEVWGEFIEYVVTQAIPNALEERKNNINELHRKGVIREDYRTNLINILNTFSGELKNHFIKLHNTEIENHQTPLRLLENYKLDVMNQARQARQAPQKSKPSEPESESEYKPSETKSCKSILIKMGWPRLKSMARTLNINLDSKNKKDISVLSDQICNSLIE